MGKHLEGRPGGAGEAAREILRDAVGERIERRFGIFIDERQDGERDVAGPRRTRDQNPCGAHQQHQRGGGEDDAVPPCGPARGLIVRGILGLLQGGVPATAGQPGIEFVLVGVHGAALVMRLPVDGQALFLFPADNGPDSSPQVGGDFLP